MANDDFKPTHRIVFTPTNGPNGPPLEPVTWEVMFSDEGDGEGVAYTREEWDDAASASWYVDKGHWYCEGQPTPGGANGFVEVERL
jgi:hypothetical protein